MHANYMKRFKSGYRELVSNLMVISMHNVAYILVAIETTIEINKYILKHFNIIVCKNI